ncbi:ZIP family metal transporter [Desulfitibacter alkalitolerans]|uniref:ZIP family metal transporter n=1 Tax=Desulfitibacter alkalitolerans TaxID=264641 RepID=UPI000489FB94|nr:ZIP family metal transporter [Desulfitibacter alkalitolerans]
MLQVMILSLLAGLATLLGGISVLVLGRPTEKSLAIFLGLAVGIMLGVVTLDLVPSAYTYGTIFTALYGFTFGMMLLFLIGQFLELVSPTAPTQRNMRYLLNMGYLIAFGIALHDLPEGIAIAVGYAAQEHLGWLIALAIGLHNIPEGMATAAPLRMGGMRPFAIIIVIGLVSLFTPLGTMLGLYIVSISPEKISFLLALAGGAMSYIVLFKLIPEARQRHPNYARLGAAVGFAIILFLSIFHG